MTEHCWQENGGRKMIRTSFSCLHFPARFPAVDPINRSDERMEKRLEPKGQQLLMKHFVNEGGVDTGFVVWLDFGG